MFCKVTNFTMLKMKYSYRSCQLLGGQKTNFIYNAYYMKICAQDIQKLLHL